MIANTPCRTSLKSGNAICSRTWQRFGLPVLPLVAALAAFSTGQAETALTIYNQGFATVRETLHLDLKAGSNTVSYDRATNGIEPESVALRSPNGGPKIAIREQQFRRDWPTIDRLLQRYEGKTIKFEIPDTKNGGTRLVEGKIISAGNFPTTDGESYNLSENSRAVIEVEGEVRVGLPGVPRFPEIDASSVLRPTLAWEIEAEKPASFNAELSYLTDGIRWDADYNIIASEKDDTATVNAWITIRNLTGRAFEKAKVKLVAGDVRRLRRIPSDGEPALYQAAPGMSARGVVEKTFDDYHLYTLSTALSLKVSETKQVEMLQSSKVETKRIYVLDPNDPENHPELYSQERAFNSKLKVGIIREFKNSSENGLGIPLPMGRVRFYRTDSDGLVEFTGGSLIDHTPANETVRVKTGTAFDLAATRRTTIAERSEVSEPASKKGGEKPSKVETRDERGFEIVLKNHKDEPVEIHLVEHIDQSTNWAIISKSDNYEKRDAGTIEFTVTVPPKGERKVEYVVRHTRVGHRSESSGLPPL